MFQQVVLCDQTIQRFKHRLCRCTVLRHLGFRPFDYVLNLKSAEYYSI